MGGMVGMVEGQGGGGPGLQGILAFHREPVTKVVEVVHALVRVILEIGPAEMLHNPVQPVVVVRFGLLPFVAQLLDRWE
jgi:hypothetical protein